MTRVTIVQPIVPQYRAPLFDSLATQKDVELRVVSASVGHGAHDAGHVSGRPYLDDVHPWVSVPPSGALLWQRGVVSLELGEPGDVLVVCGNVRYLSNYPLMLRAWRRGVGIVWWAHGHMRNSRGMVASLRLMAMRWSDAVLLYTDDEVASCRSEVMPAEKLFATNNTVDEAPIRQAMAYWSAERLAGFRTEYEIDKGPLLLYCGRIKAQARLDLALRALRILRGSGLAPTLAIIGDGVERESLMSLAHELDIADRVRWLGAIYDQMDVAPWFLSAQALVYPGPIGLSLLHALNYGLPVITHDNRLNHKPEIAALEDRTNGLLFAENNSNDLAAKIGMVLMDPVLRDRLSQGALQIIRERYSLDRMVEGFMDAARYASKCALNRVRGTESGL